MEENLPPGFRFHPTDEELITYYLTSKVSDTAFTSKAIAVVDFNRTEPWDLPGKACMGDKEWYFFSVRDRKYPTGLRTNRATESGYWKTTGKDKEVFRASLLVGLKKTLVFYTGRAPTGHKTNWVMHEYRLHNNHPSPASKEEWVVCRVFQKSISAARKPQDTSSSQLSPESPCDDMVNEFGDADLPNFSVANSSTGFTNDNNGNVINTYTNLMSMNWAARLAEPPTATDGLGSLNIPSLSLPFLNPNLSVNSLLLKALQLKTYEQANHHFAIPSYMPHGVPNLGGTDVISNLTSASSSSKVLDFMPQQQQQQQQQAQPFNLDSLW